jgi:hypothetical protein
LSLFLVDRSAVESGEIREREQESINTSDQIAEHTLGEKFLRVRIREVIHSGERDSQANQW